MENREPIRVLHVVQRMEAAGLQSFIMNIYRNIDRNKIQFDFLTHYSEKQFYDDEIEKMGGRIYRMTVREDKNFIKYLKELKRFFAEHPEYKIVHGHMDSLGFFYLRAARRAGVPNRIAHAHTVIVGGDLKKKLRNILNRAYPIHATCLLACSEAAGEYMFGNRAFKVIHNPIEVKKFAYNPSIRQQVRKELGVDGKVVIGHVGRLSPSKNHSFLLKVFKEIVHDEPNAVLLMVGQGELLEALHKESRNLNIEEKVIFLGVRKDIERIYQAMDAFVFPSIYEGLGIVAIEAQASGLPAVCSDGVPELARATDLFVQIPLEDECKKWAKVVLNKIRDNRRTDRSEELIQAGYDVNTVKTEIVQMYVENSAY